MIQKRSVDIKKLNTFDKSKKPGLVSATIEPDEVADYGTATQHTSVNQSLENILPKTTVVHRNDGIFHSRATEKIVSKNSYKKSKPFDIYQVYLTPKAYNQFASRSVNRSYAQGQSTSRPQLPKIQ